MTPSGTDIRRMMAKALEAMEPTVEEKAVLDVLHNHGIQDLPPVELRTRYLAGVEAALAWVLGERKEPPIA